MRRLIALALLVGAVLVLPTMATGAGEDVRGPACTDVIDGNGSIGGILVNLGAPPCSAFSYTLAVYSDATMTNLLQSISNYDVLPGNQIGFSGLPVDDGIVCVVLTTSAGGGKHAFDVAPDSGCVNVATTSSGGFGGFS